MADIKPTPVNEGFASRWSRLKREGREGGQVAPVVAAPIANAVEETPLPDVTTLKPGDAIANFMQDKVSDAIKRQALKTLFKDPHFNVMDGLDIYIDDYSIDTPIPAGWLQDLEAYKTFLNPPKMQVNELGFAEEVKLEDLAPTISEEEEAQKLEFAQTELDEAVAQLQANQTNDLNDNSEPVLEKPNDPTPPL